MYLLAAEGITQANATLIASLLALIGVCVNIFLTVQTASKNRKTTFLMETELKRIESIRELTNDLSNYSFNIMSSIVTLKEVEEKVKTPSEKEMESLRNLPSVLEKARNTITRIQSLLNSSGDEEDFKYAQITEKIAIAMKQLMETRDKKYFDIIIEMNTFSSVYCTKKTEEIYKKIK